MMRLALITLVTSALVGCLGSAPPVPRDHYYRILVTAPQGGPAERRLPGVVSVPPLEADGLLRERPVLFSASGQPHEMQQHDYHYWTDPPTRLLQGQLVDYLRQSGVAQSVVTPDMRVRPDFEVTGRIKRLERLLGGGAPRVAVELELALVGLAADRLVVLRSYAVERPSGNDSVEASVVAMNRAVAEIFGRFLADARQTALAVRPETRRPGAPLQVP
jgi:cholesterol transport system auxiliary component